MKNQNEMLQLVKQVQALAENGLHFAENDFDLDRYQLLEEISLRMLSLVTGLPAKTIEVTTPERNGYRTPKVDVRAIIFNDKDEILMVKERVDSRWSLPGGWASVAGSSPLTGSCAAAGVKRPPVTGSTDAVAYSCSPSVRKASDSRCR